MNLSDDEGNAGPTLDNHRFMVIDQSTSIVMVPTISLQNCMKVLASALTGSRKKEAFLSLSLSLSFMLCVPLFPPFPSPLPSLHPTIWQPALCTDPPIRGAFSRRFARSASARVRTHIRTHARVNGSSDRDAE